jgi:signal transduction histidine kinase
MRPLTVASVVEAAADIIRPVLDAKGITLTVSIPESASVVGDPHRLQQVFCNMLANAAKFVPPGGNVNVRAVADNGSVRIRIEDDGPGIDEAFLPRIFEQFTQADASLTREFGGLGLGLAISRNFVQLHGGTIAAANRPEGGAVFTVQLPSPGQPATSPAPGARH